MINAFIFGDSNAMDVYSPKKASSFLMTERPEILLAVFSIVLTGLLSGLISSVLFPFFLAFFVSLSLSFFSTFSVDKNISAEVDEDEYLTDDETDCSLIKKAASDEVAVKAEVEPVLPPVLEEAKPLPQYDADFIFSFEHTCTEKPVGMPNFKKLVNKAIYCKRNLQMEKHYNERQSNDFAPRFRSNGASSPRAEYSTEANMVWTYQKNDKTWSKRPEGIKVPPSGRAWRQ